MKITLDLRTMPTTALPKLREAVLHSARTSTGTTAAEYWTLAASIYSEMLRRRVPGIDWNDIMVRP